MTLMMLRKGKKSSDKMSSDFIIIRSFFYELQTVFVATCYVFFHCLVSKNVRMYA